MASIPASAIVSVTPSVIGAGGTALDLNGLILTTSTRVPIGSVPSFSSAADVSSYFGPASAEAAAAVIYFNGFDNSNKKPGAVLFAQYPTASVAAYLRGANAGTLDDVTGLAAGVLTIVVDGVSKTSASINLSGASSFSNAASLILAGFTTPGFTVTYDSISGGFVFTSSTTGAGSTTGYVSGTLSAGLKLTQATGAVISQGAIASVPGTFMGAVAQTTQNWAAFTTLFDPDGGSGNDEKLLFAEWTNGTGNRYLYVPWDTDSAPTASNDATTSLGNILKEDNSSGIAPVYAPDADYAVFGLGYVASIDFEQTNGRATMAFRSQTGLAPVVTNQTVADNLVAAAKANDIRRVIAMAGAGVLQATDGALKAVAEKCEAFLHSKVYPQEVTVRNFEIVLVSDLQASGETEEETESGVDKFLELVKKHRAKVTLVGPDPGAMNHDLAGQLDVTERGIKYLDSDPKAVLAITFDSLVAASRGSLGGSNPAVRIR